MLKRVLLPALAVLALHDGAHAEPAPRGAPTAGAVVATRVGEEIDFVEAPDWRGLEVLQDVKAGDVLRTNALGQIAVLFADQTQLRLGRNSTLVVRDLAPGGDTRLELTQGRLFGRTPRGGAEVYVETPAATAAIRGTDWSMSVDGDQSTLAVHDGAVEFANPQGAVTVLAGEAATATLGQAPSKVIVINSDLREQMLVNLSLRGAFEAFSPNALGGRALRAQQARLAGVPAEARDAEDRVLAAELALVQGGRAATAAAIDAARAAPLSPGQAARLTYLEAVVAGSEGRYAEAARLFERARSGLRGEAATAARYQAYFARSLAEPTRALPPPTGEANDRVAVVGDAIIAAFLEGPRAAYAVVAAAEPRFRDDAAFQASLAQAAILAGEFDAARTAARRAVALDPGDPDALAALATVKASVDRDLDGALADLDRAIAATPAAADLWNDLGLLQSERGALREAEAAFLRALELDPQDPVARANYAVLLLDGNRVAEAQAQVDAALAADPSFELGYFARGRLQLQTGDRLGAIDSLLRATTANPTFSNGLLLLGAAYSEDGDFDLADQAFGNAGRLDPNDPVVSQYRAALSTYLYRADEAIRFAQDSVRQTRARGGDYAPIAATRDFGSTLGGAYRLLSLNAWGDFWSDVVFDPFDPGGYFDRALSGGASPVLTGRVRQLPGPEPVLNQRSFSDLLQGLLLDPMALVGPNLHPAFLRTPFKEFDIGGGPATSDGGRGWNGSATFQSLGSLPAPYTLLVSATYESLDPSYADQDETAFAGVLGFGLQPTPNDRIVGFANTGRGTGGLAFEPAPTTAANRSEDRATAGFLGWSHTFGHRNVLNAAVSASAIEQDLTLFGLDPLFGLFPLEVSTNVDQRTLKLGVSHLFGLGPVTLRYGAEGGEAREDTELELTIDYPPPFAERQTESTAARRSLGRVWIDALAEIRPGLRFEAALFGTYLEDDDDPGRLAPRLGLAWAPHDGHWLRAALMRERPLLETSTLAPIGVLGLDPLDAPVGSDQVDSAVLRWDAQWSPRVFTALEYQRQDIDDLSFSLDNDLTPVSAAEARLERASASVNLWLGGGFGAFGTVARNWSEATLATGDAAIPFVPDVSARFGITHVNPRRFAVTLAETYLGTRDTSLPDVSLDGVWTTDATGSWESPNRRLSVTVGVLNLFDAEYEIAPGLPGVGRTLTATLEARF